MSSNSTADDGHLSGTYTSFNARVLLTAVIVLLIIMAVYFLLQCCNRCILGRDIVTVGLLRNMNSIHRSDQPQPRSGLHPSVIAALPIFAYHKEDDGTGDDGLVECTVCLGQLEEGEKVRMLPRCKHLFHAGCIDMWLCSHSTCPVCRADAEPSESLRSAGSLAVVMAGLANAKEVGSTSGLGASFHRIISTDFSGRRTQPADEAVEDLERQ